ncbi:DNA-binding response regulator [Niastella koreensis]|uniref:Two component transcriptional regulator, LytTR family n=2 Tax=Niastella koreensis TaxID=354356 RepID=G8TIG5_NIAKG|nr:LytTR family transcriptional regulator DNA-binding domain-containing protein [Niastella koreensis]AEW01781.1 two component transcriptional regulator, LytTR family [Niastella koreensis GR20-10]OQP48489.1 DNA-binding response regulator [Niastella koreensis]
MSAEKVNILIVEDESIVALDLASGLEHDGYNIAGIADNAEEAQQLFTENDVDIVLMDVNIIGEKDGIDTAIEILKQKAVPIIYLTAFTDATTIERIKQTHPAAFLSKPYSLTNVRIAIDLAVNNFAVSREQQSTGKIIPLDKDGSRSTGSPEKEMILRMHDHIFVKHNYAFVKLKLSELLYIEADNNYTSIVTIDKKFLLRLSLNQLQEKINYKALVRIHRSYAVNINAIQSFNEQEVEVNQQHLPIGRNYKEEFLKQFDFR